MMDEYQKKINELNEEPDEEKLWNCIVAFQGYPFETVSGLPFSYTLKRGRNGELTKELWVDRRENSKSLAWSSIRLAFQNVLKMRQKQGNGKAVLISRPKALGDIRGVSYICPLFSHFGLISIEPSSKKKKSSSGDTTVV